MMRAGFARAAITPPVGTAMMGFGTRDMERGCDAVHDDIFARVLYLQDGAEKALVIGLDLCFVGRADADRLKGAIGRHMDVLPRAILINASHSHSGPRVGTWHYAGYVPPDRLYLDRLEDAVVRASPRADFGGRDTHPAADEPSPPGIERRNREPAQSGGPRL